MNKKGIIIYLVMKGQDEFVEKAKTYFQKSSYLLEVIEINDWQDELSFEKQEKHYSIQLKQLNKRIFL